MQISCKQNQSWGGHYRIRTLCWTEALNVNWCLFITECPLLEPPCNGILDVPVKPIPGNVATYDCVDGFELIGNKTRICQEDHTWDGISPCCQQAVAKTCEGMYLFTLRKTTYSLTICLFVC